MSIKIRLTAETKEACEAARSHLQKELGESCRLESPREGRNPKYEGEQKWFCYGQLVIEPAPTTLPPTPVRRRRRSPRS
jgi:hypothetical protein